MNQWIGGIAFFSRYTLGTLASTAVLGLGGVALVQQDSLVGTACTDAADCASGECANRYCCDTTQEDTNVAAIVEIAEDEEAAADDSDIGLGQNLGQACALGSDCKSQLCVDGVCCASLCPGTCMACNVVGMAGTCSPVAEFDDDPLATPACFGPNVWCNGNGVCVKANGQACTQSAACASGNCVDGVCCNSSCTGTCMSCSVPGSLGTCSPVPAYQGDPSASSPCVSLASCDGAGACKGAVGAACSIDADCHSDDCFNGFCKVPSQYVWSQDTTACRPAYNGNEHMRIGFSDLVAQADGRVFGIGKYKHSVMGLYADWDYSSGHHTYERSGPHDFKAQLDSGGLGATLSWVGSNVSDTWGVGASCFGITCYQMWYGHGPFITPAGGDVAFYYKSFFEQRQHWSQPATTTCTSGVLSKFAAPQWSLGTGAVCGAPNLIHFAGDDAGNVVVGRGNRLVKYDSKGVEDLNVLTPFMYPASKIALAPSGIMYAAGYSNYTYQLMHADSSGTLLWTKTLPDDPLVPGYRAFDLAVDANGNIIIALNASGEIDLGSGPISPTGTTKDLVLAKIDPQGGVLWVKRMGGPGFLPKFQVMRKTGTGDIALALSFDGTVDLGDGQITSRTVVVKYDTNGNLVWRKDLAPVLPSPTTEVISLALSGHPSGAVFVGGSAYGPLGVFPPPQCPFNVNVNLVDPKPLRLFVAKYAP